MSAASHSPSPAPTFVPGTIVTVDCAGGGVIARIDAEDPTITHRLAEMGPCYWVTVLDAAASVCQVGDTFRVRAIWCAPTEATHG